MASRASAGVLLGSKLRRARLAAGYKTQDAIAARLGVDRSHVSRMEAGTQVPVDDVLSTWIELCQIDPKLAEVYEELAELARSTDGPVPEWFEGWLGAEREAHMLRYWQPMIIPAMLQIPEYRRALVIATGHTVKRADELVAATAERQSLLDRAEPPDVLVVLDEMVLHRLVGSHEIMLDQLLHVAELGQRPKVSVQVVPAWIGANAGLSGPINLASGDGAPDVLHMDGVEGTTTETRSLVRQAAVIYERLRGEASPRAESRDLILRLADELWKQ